MSMSSALSNALSGLSAMSRTAEVASRNISNAGVEGYVRREVALGERVLAGRGAGVSVLGVSRAEDAMLTAERRRTESGAVRAEAEAGTTRALADAFGAVGSDDTLAIRLADFENALRGLAAGPESTTNQVGAVAAANGLARSMNAISTDARRLRMDADTEIKRQVDEVNDALSKIEKLNRDIQAELAGGREVTALLDERDRQVEIVNGIVPIRETRKADGTVSLLTPGGAALLEGRAQRLSFTPTPVITDAMSYEAGDLSGVSVLGRDGTPAAGGSPLLAGGALEAAFRARDETIPAFTRQIDGLARDLIERFQDLAVDPQAPPPAPLAPGLFTDGGAPFDLTADPDQETGLAGRLAVNDAVAADPTRLRDGIVTLDPRSAASAELPNALLDALGEARSAGAGLAVPGQRDAGGFVIELSSTWAAEAARLEGTGALERGRVTLLAEAELSVEGVDTDAELGDLLAIEKAYAANARVVRAVDEMLRRILEI